MRRSFLFPLTVTAVLLTAAAASAQPSGELKAKVEAKMRQLQPWTTDPEMVAAVKAHNAVLPADAREMTNAKWKSLSILDRSSAPTPATRRRWP
jgi:hypothetical protein